MDKVAIIDCGGQYTKVIDRRVREAGVFTEIFGATVAASEVADFQAIILSGGPASVHDPKAPSLDPALLTSGTPILAICYGMQFAVHALGGTVERGTVGEYGPQMMTVRTENPLLAAGKKTSVLMSHFDHVSDPGPNFEVLANTEHSIALISHKTLPIFCCQFHPEVDLTDDGPAMLKAFLFEVAKLKPEYTIDRRVEDACESIRETVGDDKVLVLVSGGVDSAVTLLLLHKTIPDENIVALHVDNGFMRQNESTDISEAFKALGFDRMIVARATKQFCHDPITVHGKTYPNIFHVVDPEARRTAIGETFLSVAEESLQKLDLDMSHMFLAQGTLRPDLIESGNPDVSDHAHTIKTHHNDVALIRTLRDAGRVIETNSEWHKDEVRQVARLLGLPESVAGRQPFPGPGLAIRMINADTTQAVEKLSGTPHGAELFSTQLRAVGVQGDERSYRQVAILNKGDQTWDDVFQVASSFTNGNDAFNRVIVPLTKVDTGSLTVFETIHDEDNLNVLRSADHVFRTTLNIDKVSQALVVLIPVGIEKKLSLVVRAIVTNDYMTGKAAHPDEHLPGLSEVAHSIIKQHPQLEAVFFDVTSKPPGTVEWL